jgi:hypothetical protein
MMSIINLSYNNIILLCTIEIFIILYILIELITIFSNFILVYNIF